MSFYIDEKLFFDFYLNNVQLPLSFNNINSMVITTNIYDILPQIRIQINDNKGILNRGMLADGTILSVAVGSDSESALKNIMDFLLIGVPEEDQKTNSTNYTVYGVLNFPKFFRNVSPFFHQGPSCNALQAIAKYCGLGFEGEITADDMTWVNGTMNLGQFAQYIRNHGWSNKNSFMMSAVDFNKKLLYKDLNALQPKYTVMNVDRADREKSFYFSESSFINKAGVYNYSYGYETQMTEFGISSDFDGHYTELAYVKDNSPVLNMSSNIYNEVGLIRNDFLQPNVGNVHSNFQQAYYQNQRYKALNSLKAELYFKESTSINILDKVSLALTDSPTKEIDLDKASSWTVEAKTLAISQQRYFEKFMVSTTGLESDVFNTLI